MLFRWLDWALVVCFFTGWLLVAAFRVPCSVQKVVQGCRWGLTWRSREHRKDRNMNPTRGLETQKLVGLPPRKKPCGAGLIYHKEGRFYGWSQRLEKSFLAGEDLDDSSREIPVTASNLMAQFFLLTQFSISQLGGGFWYLLAVHFHKTDQQQKEVLGPSVDPRVPAHSIIVSCSRFLQKLCISPMCLGTLHSGVSPCAFNSVWGNAVKPGCI